MYNIDVERIILDAMIMSPTTLPKILELIIDIDFYFEKHRIIFNVIKSLYNNKQQVTLVSINAYCTDNKIDVEKELLEILECWVGGIIDNYINDLLDYSARRKLHKLILDTNQLLQNKGYSLNQACYDIDNAIKDITKNQIHSIASMKDLSTGNIDDLSESKKFFQTGLRDLDSGIWGMFCGELIILAARPKHGKSALAGNLACYVAERYSNNHVLFFSLEMNKQQLRRRFVSQYARVDSFLIKTKKYNQDQKILIENAMNRVDDLNIHISDSKFRLEEIITASKRFTSLKSTSLIIVDYIQLINHAIKGANREQVVSDIARELKLLAKELYVPILALSQLSRAVELRPDQKPMLSDLRESGALEQHADMIWFIYQDKKEKEKGNILDNQFELEVAANRDGKAGFSIDLLFNKEYTLFESF